MAEFESLIPYMVTMMVIALIIAYISKKNKSKIVAWLFTICCGVGIFLFAVMLYGDLILGKNDWWRFNIVSIIIFLMYIAEVYEVFGKIPYYGENSSIK